MNGLLSKKINELVSTLKGSNINENVALARIKELFPSEEFKHEFIENSTDFYIEDKETIRLSSDNETKIVISYPEGDRLGNSLANSDTDIWIEYLDNDRIEKIPLFDYKQVNEQGINMINERMEDLLKKNKPTKKYVLSYIKEYLDGLPELTKAYPEVTSVTAPIETWSDDFSMAIAGIPSMVNDFTGGSFMETHYHSQFDNDDFYDEAVYRLHHELFALLILALDETAVVPLDFSPVLERVIAGGGRIVTATEEILLQTKKNQIGQEQIATAAKKLIQVTEEAQKKEKQSYDQTAAINARYHMLLANGNMEEAEQIFVENRSREEKLLTKFKQEQDCFVRIDWYGEVFFPHEILWKNIGLLQDAINALEQSDVDKALEKIYQVDNNAYAFMFDEYVYRHFTDYVFNQPKERLKWGYGRLLEHEDLYHVVKCLLKKRKEADTDYREELHYLKECHKKQTGRLIDTLKETGQTIQEMF